MLTLKINELSIPDRMHYLQHAIAPRPICFASTIDANGHVNLSPFSFFNLFSVNPPIVIFSPSRRGRDNTLKHTLQNVQAHPEVVINMVNHSMIQQMSLSSCEYPKGVNEFEKAGFTMLKSTLVKPPRVAESLIQMECKVTEIKSLGNDGGAGQLVIAEVLCMHINNAVLDPNQKIIQANLDLVARLGGDWYVRANGENIFEVPKPNVHLGIGIDTLPSSIKNSKILSGNHLGQLANATELPIINANFADNHVKQIAQYYAHNPTDMEQELHIYAAQLLNQNKVDEAWQVLLTLS
jgi:flavin reductase (DIM6/NTAB) family NADH-FMN oxidoreductase RutF